MFVHVGGTRAGRNASPHFVQWLSGVGVKEGDLDRTGEAPNGGKK